MKHLAYAQHINANEFTLKWVSTTLKNYLEKNTATTDEVEHIIDYLSQEKKHISKMSYPDAKKNAEKWLKAQIKKGNSIEEKPEDTEVVLDFKDGFKVVKLIGENAYKREGYLMSHCVAGYFGLDVEIYSLRDNDNMPHCTMERDQQIKGKGNGDIHPKYIDYVVKFLKHIGMTVGDSEMKHLGYMNVEKVKKYLSKNTNFFNKVYVPINEKLIGKDEKEFASLDLLDIIPLVSETESGLKINFNLPIFIKLSFEFLTKNKTIFSAKNASSGHSATNASSGHSATNASSGDSAKNASSGDYAKNASSGNYAKNASSGHSATNASSGHSATNASSGHSATNASSGDYAKNEMLGNNSVSVDAGANGRAKGKIGCWFCLSEWKDRKPVCVKATQIDGKIIKEDTWYTLKDGEIVEV